MTSDGPIRLPLLLPQPDHLAHHRFEDRAVLPAVEALQALARLVGERTQGKSTPDGVVGQSNGAEFLRFLPTAPGGPALEAAAELTPQEDGGVRASLLTVRRVGSAGITRATEHVRVTFGGTSAPVAAPGPADPAGHGRGFLVSRERLYGELVPFGPAFHNALDPIELREDQATSPLAAPDLPGADGPLGSPFPLDAALHLACAWGQRFHGMVTFPVGYRHRRVYCATRPGGAYQGTVIPTGTTGDLLRFDIYIFKNSGELSEAVLGVVMEDVSRGRMRAPEWIRAGDRR